MNSTRLTAPTEGFVKVARLTRSIGFFAKYDHLSDIELAQKLEKLERRQTRSRHTLASAPPDSAVLLWDDARTWREKRSIKALPGNRAYQTTIQQWSKIGRGAFVPDTVHETWITRTGPIVLTFTHNGQPVNLNVAHMTVRLNWGDLMRAINRLIQSTGIQYMVAHGYTTVVTALSEDERRTLATELGWDLYVLQVGN